MPSRVGKLNDRQLLEKLISYVKSKDIGFNVGIEQIMISTRQSYLHWVIERNLYLDARDINRSQSQVKMKLDEIYVSLRARTVDMPKEEDSHLLEKEWDEKEKIADRDLTVEEVEDLHEQLQNQFEKTRSSNLGTVSEIDKIVNRHNHLILLGDPGSGKSTLLRYLALKHAQALFNCQPVVDAYLGAAHFPILIRIADYVESEAWKDKGLSDFLVTYFMHEYPMVGIADLMKIELAKGNCLILLDGLDEIVKVDERQDVVYRIEEFVHLNSSVPNRFIISSRIAGYGIAPLGALFAVYMVQEMDETRIYRFLERWCKAVETAQTPELSLETRNTKARREIEGISRYVQTFPGVRRLATNPLLLRTLALIHRTGAQLPQKRIELYKLAADTLERIWYSTTTMQEPILMEDRNLTHLLSKLAYWIHVHKPTGIATEREVYTVLGEEWARIRGWQWSEENLAIKSEIEKILEVVRNHTGLFVERAPKRYGFIHLTFEEYYAARYLIARSKTRSKMIREHLHDPRWEEPILLALGFVGLDSFEDANELLETAILAQGDEARNLYFLPSRYENILGLDYLFALRCLGDQFPATSKITRKLIERLANELLHHSGSARFQPYQQRLSEILEYLRDSKGATMLSSLLVNALSDSSPSLRHAATQCLGLLGQSSDEVIDALLNILNNDIPGVRCVAVESLGLLGQTSSKVVDALLSALHNNYLSVEYQAAESLGLLGQRSDEVLGIILDTLRDQVPEVRRFAVQSLKLSGQTSDIAVDALFNALNDDVPEVRFEVVQSLRFLETRNFPSEAVDALLKVLNDGAADVRHAAVQSLGLLGQSSDEVIDALLNTLNNDIPWVKRAAVESLGLLGQTSSKVVDALLSALSDNDYEVRYRATQGLGRLGKVSNTVVDALFTALHDNSFSVRHQAAQSLGLLGKVSNTVVDALFNASESDDSWIRQAVVESLGLLRQASNAVMKFLFDALQDNDPVVRYQAAESLGQFGETTKAVVLTLLEAISYPKNWLIRCNSARILGKIGQIDESTMNALLHGLFDVECNVRTASAQALTQLGRRFPENAELIEIKLVQVIEDPMFAESDKTSQKCLTQDCAFESLWMLVVGDEIGLGKS